MILTPGCLHFLKDIRNADERATNGKTTNGKDSIHGRISRHAGYISGRLSKTMVDAVNTEAYAKARSMWTPISLRPLRFERSWKNNAPSAATTEHAFAADVISCGTSYHVEMKLDDIDAKLDKLTNCASSRHRQLAPKNRRRSRLLQAQREEVVMPRRRWWRISSRSWRATKRFWQDVTAKVPIAQTPKRLCGRSTRRNSIVTFRSCLRKSSSGSLF